MSSPPILTTPSNGLPHSRLQDASPDAQAKVLQGTELLSTFFEATPNCWDGKTAILEMREAGFNQWRQMEWPGFYLEFLSKQTLAPIFGAPSALFGNTRFDGFLGVPWDLKCKVVIDPKGKASTEMYLNDESATQAAVSAFGLTLLVVVYGEARFDDEHRSFYRWHEEIKGEKSAYQLSDPGRSSRVRKAAFQPLGLNLYIFDRCDLETTTSQLSLRSQGKNSNGRPRPYKYVLDMATLTPALTIFPEASG